MLFVYFKASACDRFCTFTWYFQDVILTWIPPCFAPYLIWLILSWEYTWSNKYFSWWRVLGVTHLQTAQMGQAAAWPRRSWGETIQKMEVTVFKYVTLKNCKTVILMTTFCSWIPPPPSVPSSHRTWCRKKTTFCPVLNTDLWLLCKILERRMQGSTGEQCPTVMTDPKPSGSQKEGTEAAHISNQETGTQSQAFGDVEIQQTTLGKTAPLKIQNPANAKEMDILPKNVSQLAASMTSQMTL